MKQTYCYNLGRSLKIVFDSDLNKNTNINNGISDLKKQLKQLSEMSDDELRKIVKNQYYKFGLESDELESDKQESDKQESNKQESDKQESNKQ